MTSNIQSPIRLPIPSGLLPRAPMEREWLRRRAGRHKMTFFLSREPSIEGKVL